MRAHVHVHAHVTCTRARLGVLSVCSYAKRARDLRLFCQPSRLSLVLRSLLCFTLLVLAISFSPSLSSSLCQFSFSSPRLFPHPSRSFSFLHFAIRVSLFFSSSFICYARRLWNNLADELRNMSFVQSLLRRKIARNVTQNVRIINLSHGIVCNYIKEYRHIKSALYFFVYISNVQ